VDVTRERRRSALAGPNDLGPPARPGGAKTKAWARAMEAAIPQAGRVEASQRTRVSDDRQQWARHTLVAILEGA
jgi:hypothetical protein